MNGVSKMSDTCEQMRAGFSRVRITPPDGTPLQGFCPRDLDMTSSGVRDDVYTRVLFVHAQAAATLIIGLDLCYLGRVQTDELKRRIYARWGLPAHQVLVNCSHTHSSAAAARWGIRCYTPLDETYLEQLYQAILTAIEEAMGQAREVRIASGTARTKLPMNRRHRGEDGQVVNAPNPSGPVCDLLPVCVLEDNDGQYVCVMFSIGCHPSMLNDAMISADFPGVAMRELDKHVGRPVSLFLQGAGGDARPYVSAEGDRWVRNRGDDVEAAGRLLAEEVIGAMKLPLDRIDSGLHCALVSIDFPLGKATDKEALQQTIDTHCDSVDSSWLSKVRTLWARQGLNILDRGQELASVVNIQLQMICFGDAMRIVALEGEPVAEIGWLICNQFPAGVTFPLGYSNGEGLYLPTTAMLAEGGYEVDSYWEYGYYGPLVPGIEQAITQAIGKVCDQVSV